jgi:hypothetical protein
MSLPNARGRPKEVFQINFNQDLREQLKIMSLTQLFRLLIVILVLIPTESFSKTENQSNATSIFCFFGKVIQKITQIKNIEDEEKLENVDNWTKAKNASAIKIYESSHPVTKSFILGLAGGARALIDVGFCGKFIDSLGKIVSPTFISGLGLRDAFLMAIMTRSKEAYDLTTRSAGASPMYSTIRQYLKDSIPYFHPDRPNQNKVVVFDNEQTTTYKSRIGGEKCSTKAKISLCTAVLNVYDQEGPFIQNMHKYSPKVWLYDGIKNKNIRSLGMENTENKIFYNKNVEAFWENILKEEFSSCFMEEGHIEDNISVTVKENQLKGCICGNTEKSSKRKCSKCKLPLKKTDNKKIKLQNSESKKITMSAVERRKEIFKDIERGPDIKPAELVMGKPLLQNPSRYEDTKNIIREESINSGISKYGAGERAWLTIACDGSPFKNFLTLLPVLTFCSTCLCPAGNTSKHLKEAHNDKKDTDQIQLEFDHVLPINGSGHTEKLCMESVTKLLWNMIGLGKFAMWCDFETEKAKMFLMNFSDHHKGMAIEQT